MNAVIKKQFNIKNGRLMELDSKISSLESQLSATKKDLEGRIIFEEIIRLERLRIDLNNKISYLKARKSILFSEVEWLRLRESAARGVLPGIMLVNN